MYLDLIILTWASNARSLQQKLRSNARPPAWAVSRVDYVILSAWRAGAKATVLQAACCAVCSGTCATLH